MKFGFVVLHYKTFQDTINCVNSVLNLDGQKRIIIVDNFSNDGSLEKLLEYYEKNELVAFVKSKKNLGFAKGNNLGIIKAKEFGCDFVVLLNNDTIIKQKDFMELCIDDWKTSGYFLAGPRIISLIDGGDQNPFIIPRHYINGFFDSLKLLLLGIIKYFMILINVGELWQKDVLKKTPPITNGLEKTYLDSKKSNFLICGAVIIMSPDYINKYGKLCDKTFLYEEETIIYFLAKRLQFRFVYNPQIVVYHKEKSSTNASISSVRSKLIFGYKEDLKSRWIVFLITLHKNNLNYLSNLIKF